MDKRVLAEVVIPEVIEIFLEHTYAAVGCGVGLDHGIIERTVDGLAFIEELWAIHPAFGIGAGFIPIINEPPDVVGATNCFEISFA